MLNLSENKGCIPLRLQKGFLNDICRLYSAVQHKSVARISSNLSLFNTCTVRMEEEPDDGSSFK